MTVWPAGLHAGHLTLETPESMAEFEYVLDGQCTDMKTHMCDVRRAQQGVAETDDTFLCVCFFVDKKEGAIVIDSGIGTRIKIKRVNNVFEVEAAVSPGLGGSGPARP